MSPALASAVAHSWASKVFPDWYSDADNETRAEYELWLCDDHGLHPDDDCEELWEKFVNEHGEFACNVEQDRLSQGTGL